MSTINERFKLVRLNQNMKQEDFAKALSISRPHVSNIERGSDMPSSSLIAFICYRFNVPEEWLKDDIGSICSSWDVRTDDGCISYFKTSKVMLENFMYKKSGEELQLFSQMFAYFVSIATSYEQSRNSVEHLKICKDLFDSLESFIFLNNRKNKLQEINIKLVQDRICKNIEDLTKL